MANELSVTHRWSTDGRYWDGRVELLVNQALLHLSLAEGNPLSLFLLGLYVEGRHIP
jgi:hypothetical protein